MTKITVNSKDYSDDGTSSRDMLTGGHRLWFLAMIGDAIIDLAAKVSTAAGHVSTANSHRIAAGTSATNAATSATNAGTSETNAAGSATAAGTSATNAANSATAAANSAQAALPTDSVTVTNGLRVSTGQLAAGPSTTINIGSSTVNPPRVVVRGTSGTGGGDVALVNDSSSTTVAGELRFAKSLIGLTALTAANTLMGFIKWFGHDGASFFDAAAIGAFTDSTPATGDISGRLSFQTVPAGSAALVERMVIDGAGRVGMGVGTSAAYKFRIGGNVSGGTALAAVRVEPAYQSDATASGTGFFAAGSTAAAAFTMAAYRHFYTSGLTIGTGSAVSSQYGFLADSGLTTATNNYGFHGNIAAATGRWNFYAGGTAQNYLAGNLGIGSGKTVPGVALDVNGTINGTTHLAGLGLVGTPSYAINGDTNTGMWSPGADILAFSTGGAERLRLTGTTAKLGSTLELVLTNVEGIRHKSADSTAGIGMLHYNDGATYYILATNAADADGAFNTLRPFYVSLSTGVVGMDHGLNVSGSATIAQLSVGPENATEGGQINFLPPAGETGMAIDHFQNNFRFHTLPAGKWVQVLGASGTIELTPGGWSAFEQLRLKGSGFKYVDCESDHLAFYKKTGANHFYWRRSDTGRSDGANNKELMYLADDGLLVLAGNVNTGVIVTDRTDYAQSWMFYASGSHARFWHNTQGEKFRVEYGGNCVAQGNFYANGGTNAVYHSGNLTNLNQLTNGPGYITGITSGNVTTALGYTPLPSVNFGVPLGHTGSLGIEVTGSGGGAAAISFHRPGSYAINFGLETDNQLRVGGWSMGQGATYRIWHEGNLQPITKHGVGAYIVIGSYGSGTVPGVDVTYSGGAGTILSGYVINNGGGGAHIGGSWVIRGVLPGGGWLAQRYA